jgi:UDP-GlcNAc:undecaprenyl-phosphate GlcNAc-1-phosphate transferase
MPSSLAVSVATTMFAAFAIAILATPVVRAVARRAGAIAQPKSDRWHSKPTAMFGGVGVFIAMMAVYFVAVPHSRDRWVLMLGSAFLFLIGLVDDIVHIKPYQKLVGQLIGAATIISFGLVLPWTGSFVANMFITFFWLVGITNAVNMLDNMDGLAAGVSAIAALFLGLNFLANGQTGEALLLSAFAGALIGFLIYNHNPASIFMGDCGSMFIGFFLASSALLSGWGGGRSRSVLAVLAVPVLVLVVPIFDTTFVTLMRKMAGRSASVGGRDHTSHRLVALGLSEKHAVWMLYAFAMTAGLLSLLVRHYPVDVMLAATASFTVILTLVGVYLGRVRVYDQAEIEAARDKPLVALLVDLSYKRRIFEVALDTTLIVLSYYLAYAALFGRPVSESGDWQVFLRTIPIVVLIKLSTFLASGVYRGMWKYAGLANLIDYTRAVFLSSLITIITFVFAFRFRGFSRTVFVLDALLLLVMLCTSRLAFRLMRGLLPMPHARTGRKVLIYGAGDGGELLARELLNNSALQRIPVGYIDDDPRKAGRMLHGLRVYNTFDDALRRERAVEVLLSTPKIPREKIRALFEECRTRAIVIGRMSLEIHTVDEADVSWVMPSADEAAFIPVLAEESPRVPIADHKVEMAAAAEIHLAIQANAQISK